MKTKVQSEIMWFIHGKYGFYAGGNFRRSDVIKHHCAHLGKTWKECRKDGDRAVKCWVMPFTKEAP